MKQTLFYLPHSLFEGPLLIGWAIVGLLILGILYWRHGNSSETWNFLPIYLIVAAVIYAVLPQVEIMGLNPDDLLGPMIPAGLAIRGYGLFLLTAISAGVYLATKRCEHIGLDKDQILQLAFWMIVTGIIGARLFYVIQKRDAFFSEPFSYQTLLKMVDMTKGGLVVYGSLIGGMVGGAIYFLIHKLPVLKVADLVAPGMVLGLAIGRLGCLMNGCCYGGVCEPGYPAITFPAGSPPYMQQLVEGPLLGIQGSIVGDASLPVTIDAIEPGSIAESLNLEIGDQVAILPPSSEFIRFQKLNPDHEVAAKLSVIIQSQRAGELKFTLDQLPERSRRTQPTQIYSSLNAFLLCALLWLFWTLPHRDGQVFALMLVLYAIARFLMEIVRQDEQGQFGTAFTISQWVSMGMLVLGFLLWAYTLRPQDQRPAETPQVTA